MDTFTRFLSQRYTPWPSSESTTIAKDRLAPAPLQKVVLKRASSPLVRQALHREIELFCRLAHPSLPRLHAVARDSGFTTVVFEYLAAPTIAKTLRTDPQRATRLAIDLLALLHAIHTCGVVHGDLKPDHILVEPHAIRLLDLGLAADLGSTPRGGTHGFIPPEYKRGNPVSVAGDLYAFGATLRAAAGGGSDQREPEWTTVHEGPRARRNAARSERRGRSPLIGTGPAGELPSPLRDLIESCLQPSPERRPASAGAALSMLGASLPTPGASPNSWLGSRAPLDAALDILRRSQGQCLVVEAEPGAGRTRFVDELVRARALDAAPIAAVTCKGGFDPLLSPLIGGGAAGIPLVLDDVGDAPESMGDALRRVALALVARGQGAMVVVGPRPWLLDHLTEGGAQSVRLPTLGEREVTALLRTHRTRSDKATTKAIVERSHGRAGLAVRAVRLLSQRPSLSAADLADLMVEWMERGSHSATPRPRNLTEAVSAATDALDQGAPRRAASILRAAAPELEANPQNEGSAAVVLALAEVRAGRLSSASAILDKIGDAAPDDVRLEHARCLERQGHHTEARKLALELTECSTHQAEAGVVAATSAMALGLVPEADALAEKCLSSCELAESTAVRLLALRSDAAMRSGDAKLALARGQEAVTRARATGEDALTAHALSRVAAARALSGNQHGARDDYASALSLAERAADGSALPPYLSNLATAEHALGELGDAICHYERAAQLAEHLGRTGSRAASLTNLAGLLASIGAHQEARRVLESARQAATDANFSTFLAQIQLIEAELEAHRNSDAARRLARNARAAFLSCGDERRALEAQLLDAEIALVAGDISEPQQFADSQKEAIDSSDLRGRGASLRARLAIEARDFETARREGEIALAEATEAGDREARAQALDLLAMIHERLGTGAQDALRQRAREAYGELAARLPPGLRERYLADPTRTKLLHASSEEPSPSPRARGLDNRARHILALLGRVLLDSDEQRVLEAAVDEAVSLTAAERAFLLRRQGRRRPQVAVARNLDRETIRNSRFRYSRSVAEQVLETGTPLVTESATEDPALRGARSVLDLGLRSILCVPIRTPHGVVGALYLDHRFHAGHFGEADLEVVQALADVIGLALENARLHRDALERAEALASAHEALRIEGARKDAELERLAAAVADASIPVEESTGGIVGRSEELRRVIDVARRVAPSDIPVLIEGESGTGKELFARFVHDRSRRASGPFVAINCGALPESVMESELFGHVRGAFTGALRDHPGVFRTASGGTLLLDEIGEMTQRMQTRLLRVLQEHEVRPVGGERALTVNVRIIAATNRELVREVEAGGFRRDLYFRLAGVRVALPPLRDRRDDILPLAQATLRRIAREPGMREVALGPDAVATLLAHDWPGNVRELQHCLRRAVAVTDHDRLEAADLGLSSPKPRARQQAVQRLNVQLIQQALRASGGNRTMAARALGVSRVTLHRWITKYGVATAARPGRPRRKTA